MLTSTTSITGTFLKNTKNYIRKSLCSEVVEVNTPLLKPLMEDTEMREKAIEAKLTQAAKALGGIAPKFTSPGLDGMPDRIVLLPGGHIGFVEVKAPGEKPRPLQLARHGLLRRLGFNVYVLDQPEQIGGILDEIYSDL